MTVNMKDIFSIFLSYSKFDHHYHNKTKSIH